MKTNKSDIEKTILEQIKQFGEKKGIVPYLVGGYIRDKYLRRKTHDIDIVFQYNALDFAKDFSKEFHYPIPVFYGRFGTAMIQINKIKIEFATARKESYSSSSRKPDVIPADIYQDLLRRDFTINSIAQNLLTGEILDPFEGKKDIKNKIIKTPIDPDKTFYDDPLRILRGIRFATLFRFQIDEKTKQYMAKNGERLSIVSMERIAEEIMKILSAQTPSIGFYLLDEIDILKLLLPEIANLKEKRTEHPCKELFPHTLQTLDNISKRTKNVYLRLSALLHDIGKPKTLRIENGKVSFHRHEFLGEKMSYKVCERLKISFENAKMIALLIRYHLRPHLLAKENPSDNALIRFAKEIGNNLKGLFTLAKSDITSKNEKKVKHAIERLDKLYERIKILKNKMRLAKFKLAIDGFTIMKILNIPSGKKVGEIKNILEEMVLDGKIPNRKKFLLDYLKTMDKNGI
ncbi:MAG: CCA tRNA nucleotidyltransferase [Candidatus Omnitrophica bacterium]|jgi:putative nucleotidyltransferase with HDIG domain|nr:CCA tRNA nucleotidyltransferase [Candidatus Omnitrophota bacterium]